MIGLLILILRKDNHKNELDETLKDLMEQHPAHEAFIRTTPKILWIIIYWFTIILYHIILGPFYFFRVRSKT